MIATRQVEDLPRIGVAEPVRTSFGFDEHAIMETRRTKEAQSDPPYAIPSPYLRSDSLYSLVRRS